MAVRISRGLILVLVAVTCGLFTGSCLGFSTYRDAIPNGHNVEHPCKPNTKWEGVGHLQQQGGGPRNVFGLAFKANNYVWNRTLCMMDSDGDGQTNGQELGDPNCIWTRGGTPTRSTGITHPGFKTPADQYTFSLSDPATLDCSATPVNCPAKSQDHVRTMDLKMARGTRVPTKTTTYYCTSFKVPDDVPYHAIAFDALLDNLNVIHHMLLYGCSSHTPQPTGECDMSSTVCRDLIAVWSLGLPDQCLPEVAGMRFGNATYSYFQLQVHWNNPMNVAGYTDESGMRIHYTPRLRLYDMGIMWLGQYLLFIPPRVQNTTLTTQCNPTCSKHIVPHQLNISASIVHMHLLGKQARIRHTRQGVTNDIVFDEVYDYNTPKWTYHSPHVLFDKNDSFELVCTFDSTSRAINTTYGDATNDEMCFGFLQYFPKAGDLQCTQWGSYDLCTDDSTVCGPQCSLSVLFQNVTNLVNQGVRECDQSCNNKCRESVRALYSMYVDPCLKTRHRTAYQAFSSQIAPLAQQLRGIYITCSTLHPAYFNSNDLQNLPANKTAAEVSVFCPSDEGVVRFLPSELQSLTTQVVQATATPSSANTNAPLHFLLAIALAFCAIGAMFY